MKALVLSLLFSSTLSSYMLDDGSFSCQPDRQQKNAAEIILDRAVAARFLNEEEQIVYFSRMESGQSVEDIVKAAEVLLEGSFTLELRELEDDKIIFSKKVKL